MAIRQLFRNNNSEEEMTGGWGFVFGTVIANRLYKGAGTVGFIVRQGKVTKIA